MTTATRRWTALDVAGLLGIVHTISSDIQSLEIMPKEGEPAELQSCFQSRVKLSAKNPTEMVCRFWLPSQEIW